MTGPTSLTPKQQRLSLDQEIEKALEKLLGNNYKNNPNIKIIREEVKKNLESFLVASPIFYEHRKTLSVVLSYFIQQQSDKLTQEEKLKVNSAPSRKTSLLITDCLTLIKELEQKDPDLATRLTLILKENAPKLNSEDPNEKVQALKIIFTMHMLLDEAQKTNNTKQLETFAKDPQNTEINQLNPAKTKSCLKSVATEMTDTQMANLNSMGIDMETGRTGVPIAETIGMVITPAVTAAIISVAPEETAKIDPEAAVRYKTPFDSMLQGPTPKGDTKKS